MKWIKKILMEKFNLQDYSIKKAMEFSGVFLKSYLNSLCANKANVKVKTIS